MSCHIHFVAYHSSSICHDLGVGSTPGSSGSSLKRRDSTSSLLRRRRRNPSATQGCTPVREHVRSFLKDLQFNLPSDPLKGALCSLERLERVDLRGKLLGNRSQRSSTLGLLQQELAEPLEGSASRSKAPWPVHVSAWDPH